MAESVRPVAIVIVQMQRGNVTNVQNHPILSLNEHISDRPFMRNI